MSNAARSAQRERIKHRARLDNFYRPFCEGCGDGHARQMFNLANLQQVKICEVCARRFWLVEREYIQLLRVIAKRRGHLSYTKQKTPYLDPTGQRLVRRAR